MVFKIQREDVVKVFRDMESNQIRMFNRFGRLARKTIIQIQLRKKFQVSGAVTRNQLQRKKEIEVAIQKIRSRNIKKAFQIFNSKYGVYWSIETDSEEEEESSDDDSIVAPPPFDLPPFSWMEQSRDGEQERDAEREQEAERKRLAERERRSRNRGSSRVMNLPQVCRIAWSVPMSPRYSWSEVPSTPASPNTSCDSHSSTDINSDEQYVEMEM